MVRRLERDLPELLSFFALTAGLVVGSNNKVRLNFVFYKKHWFHPPILLISHVPVFVMRTPVLPARRRTENLTNRASRFEPMPPRSLEISGCLCG
jgi:hypothetical protein